MLANEKWSDAGIIERVDLRSLLTPAHMIAWLERQNPFTQYNYYDNFECVVARFCRSLGRRVRVGEDFVFVSPDGKNFADEDCERITLHPAIAKAVNEVRVRGRLPTYGDVLAHLRAQAPAARDLLPSTRERAA